jgi:hypothetical protein
VPREMAEEIEGIARGFHCEDCAAGDAADRLDVAAEE